MKYVLMVLVAFMFVGCAQNAMYMDTNTVVKSKPILFKNYVIGKIQTSYVGEPIIQVKDYHITTKSTDKMKAIEDFVFNTDGRKQFYFKKGDLFSIKGRWVIDNKSYLIAERDKDSYPVSLLINKDGTIHNKILLKILFGSDAGKYVNVIYTYKYKPKTAKLERVTTQQKVTTKGKVNYEIIYTGSSDKSFYLTYREFTKDNMARTSFFQNLTYSKEQKRIRFKNLSIKINNVDNEKISFTVLSD